MLACAVAMVKPSRRRDASGRHAVLGLLLFAAIAVSAPVSAAQAPSADRSGAEVFRAGCAACHGVDGRGTAQSIVGFDTPLPDFTDCSFASREPAADWFAIAHDGGPVRAFNRRMPAFGEALTTAEIERTIDYVRGLCADPAWPHSLTKRRSASS